MIFTSKSLLNRWGTPATTNSTVRNYRAVRRRASHVASYQRNDNTIIVNSLVSNINTLKSFFESSHPLYTLCLAGEKETIGGDLHTDLSVGGFIHLYAGTTDYDSINNVSIKNMINTFNAACIDVIGYDTNGYDLGTHTLALVLNVEEPGLKKKGYGKTYWNDLSVYGCTFKISFETSNSTTYYLKYDANSTYALTATTTETDATTYTKKSSGYTSTPTASSLGIGTPHLVYVFTTEGNDAKNYISRNVSSSPILANSSTSEGTGYGMLWTGDLTYANFADSTGTMDDSITNFDIVSTATSSSYLSNNTYGASNSTMTSLSPTDQVRS